MKSTLIYVAVILIAYQNLATCALNGPIKREADKKRVTEKPAQHELNSIIQSSVKGENVKIGEAKDKGKEAAATTSQDGQNDKELVILIDGQGTYGNEKNNENGAAITDEKAEEDSKNKKGEQKVESNKCGNVRCSPAPVEHRCKVLEVVPDYLSGLTGGCCFIHVCQRADGSTFLHYAFEVEENVQTSNPTTPVTPFGDVFLNSFNVFPSKTGPLLHTQRIQTPPPSRTPFQQGFNGYPGFPVPSHIPFFDQFGRQQSLNIPRMPQLQAPQFFNPPGSAPFSLFPIQNRFYPQFQQSQVSSQGISPQFNEGDISDIRSLRKAAPISAPFNPAFGGPNNNIGNPEGGNGGIRSRRNDEQVPFNQDVSTQF